MNAEERIAYVVTNGCYSDYSILAVFDNEAAAKAYVGDSDDSTGYGSRIEMFALNSTEPTPTEYWDVRLSTNSKWNHEVQRITDDWVRTRTESNRAWATMDQYSASAVHPDLDTARKIAQDLLAQIKYEHQTNGKGHLP